tara:strand:- start:378 stop:587 length:210 start_codon:yes stop_codon:yes gene_type:complete
MKQTTRLLIRQAKNRREHPIFSAGRRGRKGSTFRKMTAEGLKKRKAVGWKGEPTLKQQLSQLLAQGHKI